MGNMRDNETRRRIVAAAEELFRAKGLDGVNMRELAEMAGVNKGLLHYYFKTKQALFREILVGQMALLYGEIGVLMDGPGDLRSKVPMIVEGYFKVLMKVPELPAFVLFEVQRDPADLLSPRARQSFFKVVAAVEAELKKLKLPGPRSSGLQFIMDIIGLCAFTFGMLPGIKAVMKLTKAQRAALLQERKAHIIALVQQGLKP